MKKYILGIISIIGLGIINFSSAGFVDSSSVNTINLTTSYSLYSFGDTINCIVNSQVSRTVDYKIGNDEFVLSYRSFLCLSGDVYLKSTSNDFIVYSFPISFVGTGNQCDYSGYILESDITQSYCTNKYSNLIPESDITSSYCELEFGLIDPDNCPSSGGTGDVLRSSFWVNDRQIEGASNIYLYMPDFLSWDYTYLNSGATLQIDVQNEGDTQYIEDILKVQTYHPTSDEFAFSFVGFLTLIMPYIVVALFVVAIWRIIKKVFK